MDTSEYDGEPPSSAYAAQTISETLAAADVQMPQMVLPEELISGSLRHFQASLQQVVEQIDLSAFQPDLTSVMGTFGEQAAASLAALTESSRQSMLQVAEAFPHQRDVFNDEWFATLTRLADSIRIPAFTDVWRQDLINALDGLYAAPSATEADTDVAAVLDTEALDDLTEQGLAFVAEEGRGLPDQALRLLFLTWLLLALSGALATFVMQSEENKELVDNLGTPVGIVLPVVMAAGLAWDKRRPNAAGGGPTAEGDVTE